MIMKSLTVYSVITFLWIGIAWGAWEPDKQITIDYKETPLEEVLYDISQKAGLNYVILPELGKTPITALMKDVPAKKALEIILRAYHLSFAWTATAYGDQLQVRREILKHTSEEGK